MLREERHNLILRAVDGREAVSYEELLTLVDASSATIRRDVDQLCESGQLRKLRGGIAPIATVAQRPLSDYYFKTETQLNSSAKDAIARAALSLVQTPDSLILFGGSTVARFAEGLPSRGLTILTDSIPVANHLACNSENRVFMTGGEVFAQQGIVLSPFEDGPLFHFTASTFFMGCHAVTEAGVLEDDPLPLRVARALRKQSQRVVVLADSSKFSMSRSLVIFPLHEVDVFVTDDGISDHAVQMIEAAGSRVLVAERPSIDTHVSASDRSI